MLTVQLPLAAQETVQHSATTIAAVDSAASRRAFDYFYLQALSMKEQERYDEAYDLFEHCLSLSPESPAIYYELYWMYAYLGRQKEAVDMIQRAVEGDPENYWYSKVLASAYEEEGMRDKAILLYEKMCRQFSSRIELYYYLSAMYAEDAQYDKAIEALNNIERIEGRSEQVTLQKYRIYMLMQQKELAVSELKALVDEYPDDMRMKVFLGDTYLRFGDSEKALTIYREVLDYDSDNAYAQISLAEYYREQGNDSLFTFNMERLLTNEKFAGEERAATIVKYVGYKERTDTSGYNLSLFARLMELPFGQAETAEIYANYLLMKEVGEDSVAPVLKRLLHYEPENSFAQLQLLNYAIKRNDYAEVVMRCDTAILYNPEILELYYYRGVSYYHMKRPHDAISSFEKGLQMRTDEHEPEMLSEIFGIVGDTYHEIGNMQACMEAYDTALVYNNNNMSVLNNYAYYLSVEGISLERAEEMSLRTIKAEPENTVYIDTYMWILFKLGRYDEARAYAEKLVTLEKEEIGSVELHHCGDIYARCGDMEAALDFWKRAQEKGDTSKILKKKIKKRKYISDEKNKR